MLENAYYVRRFAPIAISRAIATLAVAGSLAVTTATLSTAVAAPNSGIAPPPWEQSLQQQNVASAPQAPNAAVAAAATAANNTRSNNGPTPVTLPTIESVDTIDGVSVGGNVLSRDEVKMLTSVCEVSNDLSSCHELGMHYLTLAVNHGLDLQINMRLAAHNLEKACIGGYENSCFFWGHALGMYGNYFIADISPEINYEKGKTILEYSCNKLNDPYGCAQLGTMYIEAKGTEQDIATGLQLFARSCSLAQELPNELRDYDSNNGMGCYYLGQSLLGSFQHVADELQGKDKNKDANNKNKSEPNVQEVIGLQKALTYLDSACNLKTAPACNVLSRYYAEHHNLIMAKTYGERACLFGMSADCVAQAVNYHQAGNDVEANRLLRIGCDLNNQDACTLLASNILSGLGTIQDAPRAHKMLTTACNQNSSLGCFYLAQLHHTGVTTIKGFNLEQNLSTARELYRKSCRLGNDIACTEFKKLISTPNTK